MRGFPTREQVAQLRKMYPPGTRVCVDWMENDSYPIEPGTMGTVTAVDDAGTLHCKFDNGRHLGLIHSVDAFHTEADRFISLSTCSYEFKNARTVLTGKLIEMEEE